MVKRNYLKTKSHKQSMSYKKLMLVCLFLFLVIPFVSAADGGIVDENTRVWSNIIVGDSLYNAHNLTLSLYNPNGTNIITDYNMSFYSTGIYYYDFVPQTTGNYIAIIEVYNTTAKIATGSGSLYITPNETTNQMILAITLALIGLGFLAAYISHNIKLEEIPRGRIAEKALYYALSFIFFIGTPIFLLVLAENNSSLSYLQSFLSTTVIVTTLVGFAIILFYIIYHFKKRLERLTNQKEEQENDHTQ